MAAATIEFPNGQHAKAGKKLRLKVTYTGAPPAPTDVHVLTRQTGATSWQPLMDMDIPAGIAPANGLDLDVPVTAPVGSWDIKIDWTWTGPPRREEGRVGQYFVDEAAEGHGDGVQHLTKLDLSELYKTLGLPVTIVLSLFALIGYGITWLIRKNLGPWKKFLNQLWNAFPRWFRWLLRRLPF